MIAGEPDDVGVASVKLFGEKVDAQISYRLIPQLKTKRLRRVRCRSKNAHQSCPNFLLLWCALAVCRGILVAQCVDRGIYIYIYTVVLKFHELLPVVEFGTLTSRKVEGPRHSNPGRVSE